MKVRIEKPGLPWMEDYLNRSLPVLKTTKTEKGTKAVQVKTPEGPLWIAAHNLRRVSEAEDAA